MERVGVSLWRQRRLIRAETATIKIDMTEKAVVEKVRDGLGVSHYGNHTVIEEDLQPPDQELLDSCQAVITECDNDLSLNQLQENAPRVYEQLIKDADGQDLLDYLDDCFGFHTYVADLKKWCEIRLERADKFEQITGLVETARNYLSVPHAKAEYFNKYQVALDNQLFKATRTFRETQDHRLKIIDSEVVV